MSKKLKDLPVSSTFTSNLPPDPLVPTVQAMKKADDRILHVPRFVEGGGLFTYLTPSLKANSQLLAYSPSSVKSLGLEESETQTEAFQQLVVGSNIDVNKCCPWAQCYGGYQFGDWAGQLGDGRVVSLCELTNPETGKRFEIQVKGAGRTPYSRFADGKAVLRSSIREYLCCEALYALGIPTTQALAISNLEGVVAQRETVEPCAVVCRMAPSWIRIGTFDLQGINNQIESLRKLADYCLNFVLKDGFHGGDTGNRYEKLLRDVAYRNAKTVAKWQAYGFMNGVLNTDNTSILGLSIDYGPFGFLDVYNPSFTPNHDDVFLRYSYRNQPDIIIWNLSKLASALVELIGACDKVDDLQYMEQLHNSTDLLKKAFAYTSEVFEKIVEEYKNIVQNDFYDLMFKRVGLPSDSSNKILITDLLQILEDYELDMPNCFSFLSRNSPSSMKNEEYAAKLMQACICLNPNNERVRNESVKAFTNWVGRYSEATKTQEDSSRLASMKKVNPHFTLRNWVLEEVIKEAYIGKFELFKKVCKMAACPFEDTWGFSKEEEDYLCYNITPSKSQIQCSCSS